MRIESSYTTTAHGPQELRSTKCADFPPRECQASDPTEFTPQEREASDFPPHECASDSKRPTETLPLMATLPLPDVADIRSRVDEAFLATCMDALTATPGSVLGGRGDVEFFKNDKKFDAISGQSTAAFSGDFDRPGADSECASTPAIFLEDEVDPYRTTIDDASLDEFVRRLEGYRIDEVDDYPHYMLI
eukprot:GHVO01040899.1.p1 GENE.GHVO01040899.1~~GHVO01040899.1.p1  ORF type:complete len:190 (-),score=35.27 GHVO01040899.1:64-633(-)